MSDFEFGLLRDYLRWTPLEAHDDGEIGIPLDLLEKAGLPAGESGIAIGNMSAIELWNERVFDEQLDSIDMFEGLFLDHSPG